MNDVRNIHNNGKGLQVVSLRTTEQNHLANDVQDTVNNKNVTQGSMIHKDPNGFTASQVDQLINKLYMARSIPLCQDPEDIQSSCKDNYKDQYEDNHKDQCKESSLSKKLKDNRKARYTFLKRVIDEYCGIYYLQNEFKVNVQDLSLEDVKIFLSYVVDADEYEDYCSSSTKLYAGFIDNRKYMQSLLDEVSEDFYSDYLYEMRADVGSQACYETMTLEDHYGTNR